MYVRRSFSTSALVRVLIKQPYEGYYLRWYYHGWHYWFFLPGETNMITEGQNYRTIGTRKIKIGSGQINEKQCAAIRTIMNTREVSVYTNSGWKNVKIEPGLSPIKTNEVTGYEIELIAIIGSREVSSISGYSPTIPPPIIPPMGWPEILIGTQIWMTMDWKAAYPNSKVYDDDEANRDVYGGLYTYDQVMSSGFCPTGWHVPTDAEWATLIIALGGDTIAGGKLKETGLVHWDTPNTGANNLSGFTARGGGNWNVWTNLFQNKNLFSFHWTATEASPSNAWASLLSKDDVTASIISAVKGYMFSLRLIKDSIPAGVLTDFDSNVYTSVIIGTKEWLCQNLKVTHYRGGYEIPNLTNVNDWYLPSLDELWAIRTELYMYGLGSLQADDYWSSTEIDALTAETVSMFSGGTGGQNKSNVRYVRAIRNFTSSNVLALRDAGTGGGLIFHIIDNFDGTYTYFEANVTDCADSAWSDIIDHEIGAAAQGTAIGTGQSNSTAIINQSYGESDWFLPSINELDQMYLNLKAYGVGGFTNNNYWSSTELNATSAFMFSFNFGSSNSNLKSTTYYVRACRVFTAAVGAYSLRDTGPAGGLIFYISGTTYYEAAPSDQSSAKLWSNIDAAAIGTTSPNIGEGQNNTNEIIGQVGHTDSSALLCDNYSNITTSLTSAALLCDNISGGASWAADTVGAMCYYNNDISYKNEYGALYNWYAVNNANGINYVRRGWVYEPDWRVATQADWQSLIAFLGGTSLAGGKLKELGFTHWNTPNTNAINLYGFSGLGAGYRNSASAFLLLKSLGLFWTQTEHDATDGENALMEYNTGDCSIVNNTKSMGFSIRLVRDV